MEMKNNINNTLISFYSKVLSNNVLFRYNIIIKKKNWNIYVIYVMVNVDIYW